jgi:hypothetical protein
MGRFNLAFLFSTLVLVRVSLASCAHCQLCALQARSTVGHGARQEQKSRYRIIYWDPRPHLVFWPIRTCYYHSDSGTVILNDV